MEIVNKVDGSVEVKNNKNLFMRSSRIL